MSIRTCWAYGPNGRCDMPAGHTGDHSITIAWTDDQCVVPSLGQGQPAQAVTEMSDVTVQVPVQVKEVESCVACDHMHKAGPCKCGCYSHI